MKKRELDIEDIQVERKKPKTQLQREYRNKKSEHIGIEVKMIVDRRTVYIKCRSVAKGRKASTEAVEDQGKAQLFVINNYPSSEVIGKINSNSRNLKKHGTQH